MGARELLADLSETGLSVTADGNRLVVRPASKLTEPIRSALRDAKPELLALLKSTCATPDHLPAVCWADADIERFQSRRDRLMRWGWAEPEAEALAERLVKRDREQDDDRVSCADCRHCRPGRCCNHRRAGLHSPDIGRPLMALLQRCRGFACINVMEPNNGES
jgi:hypothetical protein